MQSWWGMARVASFVSSRGPAGAQDRDAQVHVRFAFRHVGIMSPPKKRFAGTGTPFCASTGRSSSGADIHQAIIQRSITEHARAMWYFSANLYWTLVIWHLLVAATQDTDIEVTITRCGVFCFLRRIRWIFVFNLCG